ncbi:MAG: hypothetical protein JNL35_14260 [Sphingopyxis sp.]|nr:hypothetical protein [Sphingopyxis sp.]
MGTHRIETIGAEARPLCILDDFAPDPDGLRDFAAAAAFEAALHHYPGIRAALPAGYFEARLPVIAEAAAQTFGRSGAVTVIDASFSIVTTPVEALSVAQRMPHVDAFTADRIAFIHYLSPEGDDGTAFFRHRSTGFETVGEDRRDLYFRQLDTELRYAGPPPAAYVADNTPLFARTHVAAARYNRALLYRSDNLHSGAISPDASLSPNPRAGRLTVTAFLSIG